MQSLPEAALLLVLDSLPCTQTALACERVCRRWHDLLLGAAPGVAPRSTFWPLLGMRRLVRDGSGTGHADDDDDADAAAACFARVYARGARHIARFCGARAGAYARALALTPFNVIDSPLLREATESVHADGLQETMLVSFARNAVRAWHREIRADQTRVAPWRQAQRPVLRVLFVTGSPVARASASGFRHELCDALRAASPAVAHAAPACVVLRFAYRDGAGVYASVEVFIVADASRTRQHYGGRRCDVLLTAHLGAEQRAAVRGEFAHAGTVVRYVCLDAAAST